MMRIPMLILMLAACFLAAVLNLAVKSRYDRAFTRIALLLTGAIGAVMYGYGYAWTLGFTPVALFRALLAVCRMFAGINDLSAIQEAPWFRSPAVMTIFWMGHFLGFYVTASATITTLGERLLRRIRVLMLKRGPLLLIYGAGENAIQYGKDAAQKKHRAILYVDPEDRGVEATVKTFGALADSGKDALHPDAGFLRRIGMKPGGRNLEVALLHGNGPGSLRFAMEMRDALAEAGIGPEQTSLMACGIGEAEDRLLATAGKGYGSVYVFDEYELAARQVIRYYPPCDSVTFDEAGRAEQDYHAVIVGFGRMGRAMLNHLVMNGQMEGSSFRVDVFDTLPQDGPLLDHPMQEAYDIRFHSAGGHSRDFYAFLREHLGKVQAIFLCTGAAAENADMADDLTAWYHQNPERPALISVSREGIFAIDRDGCETVYSGLYRTDVLDPRRMDARAMQIHAVWAKNPKGPEEAWKSCDAFGRASCRAAADFYPTLLRAAGRRQEEVIGGNWPPEGEMMENLARTEHLRWCAFHSVMGYRPMSEAEFEEQVRRLRQGQDISLGKDRERRLHACLVPWEQLDALSAKVGEVTGRRVDYKEMDRENVRALAQVLKASVRMERGAEP